MSDATPIIPTPQSSAPPSAAPAAPSAGPAAEAAGAAPPAPGSTGASTVAPAGAATPGLPRLVTVNSVNWGGVLDFTQLFRGFRLAINPAKLLAALLAILAIYAAGQLFDLAWGAQVYDGEMQNFVADTPQEYRLQRELALDMRKSFFSGKTYAEMKASYKKDFADAVETAHAARQTLGDGSGFASPAVTVEEAEQAARKSAADQLQRKMNLLNSARGRGIFDTFLEYEIDQFNQMTDDTLSVVRIEPATPVNGVAGIVGCVDNMAITGPRWLFTGTAPMQWRPEHADGAGGWMKVAGYRALYLASLVALAVFSLLMLALTGAAVTRLSALELAGIERAPLKDVFVFAVRRLWVFVKAPVAPFVILLGIGLGMAVVAMLGAVPYAGPVLIGLVFFAFLGVCFVLMLLLLGILGGFNLLYPAIAVEGADSFDAMSRSFAYVYARPWRLAFYTATALIYGVLTFLFVCFAVFLILLLTHTFVGWGMGLFGTHYGSASGVPALTTLWPEPHFLRLVSPVNWYVMSWPEFIGALLLHFWVFLLISGIGAYVISYYFSSHTIIYLLLRRSVDGQNLREVYLEEKAK